MRLKTAVITILLILFMLLVLGLAFLNGPLLGEKFNFYGYKVALGWILAASLTVGFVFFGVWLALSGLAQLSKRWIAGFRQKNERAAETAYFKGLDAVLGGRSLEAIGHFRRALEAQAGYMPALLKLGDALRTGGKAEEAVEWRLKSLNRNPKDIATLYALAEDYVVLENHEEAKKTLLSILHLQPRRALKALRMLRTIYIREANWRKAMDVQKNIERARVFEEERASDQPFTPGILYQIGVDLLRQGKTREAIARLEKIRKKYPSFRATYTKLAKAYLSDGKEDEAINVLLDGYRANTSPGCLLAMEQHYIDKDDPEGAIGHYRVLIASTDRKILPKFLLGRFFYHLELLDRAQELFKEVEGSIQESGLLQYYIGRIRQRRGKMDEACNHYRKVIRILNPFELNYRCSYCGDLAPEWEDYCEVCMRWDTYFPTFRDELMQEIQEPRPVFYQEIQWKDQ